MSSKPTQTAASMVGVPPTNHPSRWSLDVPVLPATGRRMRASTLRAVPSVTTDFMIETIT